MQDMFGSVGVRNKERCTARDDLRRELERRCPAVQQPRVHAVVRHENERAPR